MESAWGAVPSFLLVRFPRPLAEPGVRLLLDAGREVDASDFARLAGPVIFRCLIARVEPVDSFIQALVTDWLSTWRAHRDD